MRRSLHVNAKLLFITGLLLYSFAGIAQTSLRIVNENPTGNYRPLELSVSKNSETPGTDLVHICLLKAVNTSDQPVSMEIKTTTISCEQKTTVILDQEVYFNDPQVGGPLSNGSAKTIIPAHGSVEFNVKLIRPLNTPLNTWNCTEVKATGTGSTVLSNSIVIETFIPDPKDFR